MTGTGLKPGTRVRHLSPDLADWRGVVTPNARGRWLMTDSGAYVRVQWTEGLDGNGEPMAGRKPGWVDVSAVAAIDQEVA